MLYQHPNVINHNVKLSDPPAGYWLPSGDPSGG
jgi:hypothetical protein